jgi:hypothetical protein
MKVSFAIQEMQSTLH